MHVADPPRGAESSRLLEKAGSGWMDLLGFVASYVSPVAVSSAVSSVAAGVLAPSRHVCFTADGMPPITVLPADFFSAVARPGRHHTNQRAGMETPIPLVRLFSIPSLH